MKKNNSKIIITDHALIRYIERVCKISLDPIREEILSSGIKDVVQALGGTGVFPIKNYKMVLTNKIIKTVMLGRRRTRPSKKTKKYGKYTQKNFKQEVSPSRSTRNTGDGYI